jgi:hypothetical protein
MSSPYCLEEVLDGDLWGACYPCPVSESLKRWQFSMTQGCIEDGRNRSICYIG